MRQPAAAQQFGGDWTAQKLERVRKYLSAYTTIFTRNERALGGVGLRLLAAARALALGLSACATVPDSPPVIEKHFAGTLVLNGAQPPMLGEATNAVPCELGTTFGVEYAVIGSGTHTLVQVWKHPELSLPEHGVAGTTTRQSARIKLEHGEPTSSAGIWTITDPREQRPGEYTLLVGSDGKVLLKEVFVVTGCPHASQQAPATERP